MSNNVSAIALADLFGVTDRTIRDLAKRGIIIKDARGYALAKSVRGYCKHLRELATGRGGESAISSVTAERARLAKAQADLTETKVRVMHGELVEASAVETEWSGVLRTVRAGMLAVPSRCAARLPHLSGHDVAEIDSEVRAVLTEVGKR
jgi:phage terminase Nu1 subunit (DNA packaging protein)